MIVNIIGAGTWGVTLAYILNKNFIKTNVYCRNINTFNYINNNNFHPNLDKFKIPDNVNFTNSYDDLNFQELTIIATSSSQVLSVLEKIKSTNKIKILIASKGFDLKMKDLITNLLIDKYKISPSRIAVLSGPNHAEEIIKDKPTASVVASTNSEYAKSLQKLLSNSSFRVYTSNDINGVQVGGAVKNIIAIAAGVCEGLNYGDNIRATLVSRGMREIYTFGNIFTANKDTLYGLSGLGDLICTCYSKHSRNRQLGYYLGKGYELQDSISKINMVVEGINAAKVIHHIKSTKKLVMPICSEIYDILYKSKDPKESINALMNRELIDEN